MAIYENLSPNGHYTMAQRIFYKISLLLNRKIRTISYDDFQLLSQAEKDDGTQWCVYGAPDTTVLKYYPVGSYYETSDTTFDPNTAWSGTTWVLETEGLVHVSSGTNYTVSADAQDGGESKHTLTAAEMPSHGHNIRVWNTASASGVWKYWINNGTELANNPYGLRGAFNASWANGNQSAAQSGNGDQAGRSDPSGGGQSHNNMQPYKIVNRWHRTA